MFGREIPDDSIRHYRDLLFHSIVNVVLDQVAGDSGGVSKGDGFGAFEDDEAGVNLAVGHGEGPCVEALSNLLARLDDRFNQLGAFVTFADVDQMRALRLLAVGKRVAVDA